MHNALRTEHSVSVDARADVVYEILADVSRWPLHFTPTIHAERTAGTEELEMIKIWALANGVPRSWGSKRVFDRRGRRITFRQESSPPPLRFMEGSWHVTAVTDRSAKVLLTHDFGLLTDDPADLAWVSSAVEANSAAELESVKRAAESPADVCLEFADTVAIQGGVTKAYDFIYDCSQWPARLPHVARLAVTEDVPGIQIMEMDTFSAADRTGEVHTTKSVRICVPQTRIIYKQTVLPRIMTSHTGEWLFAPTQEGTNVTSKHSVLIDMPAARELLPGRSVDDIRRQVQAALSGNSRSTLQHAKAQIEWDGTRHPGASRPS